ncbi:MAG TPA: mechanosensitive ion channel domain-containing protein, partial [Chitinophagaceae bacterium]|nr:mechanosensitive ion channel domain-containing protein [Chitinophagaceae bacterium]
IENLIASFIIFFDKPFATGDLVKVLNITGTVERIGLRSTRIRTDQKTYVTVPNKQMVDTVLDNLSLRTQIKTELKLEIDLNTSSDKVEKLINGVKKIVTREGVEESNVYMSDITGRFFLLQADYLTAPVTFVQFTAIRQAISLDVLRLMESLQIEIAGANTDVRVNGLKDEVKFKEG